MLINISNLLNEKGKYDMNMKKKAAIFVTAILMMILGTGTALASADNGCIDGGKDGQVYGWAWDASLPDTAVEVQISVKKTSDNSVVSEQTVTADQYREDLSANQIGNGSHAFSASIDWSSLENTEYAIEARVGDTLLNGSLYYRDGSYSTYSAAVLENSGAEGHKLVSLGSFKTTAYCPCRSCSEGWGRHTCTGAIASANHTIAVDPRVIPYGSKVLINGTVYTAEDKGGAVKGNHIDIFFDTHGETRTYGTRSAEVFLIQDV